jgi:hypothetical protein
MSRPPIMLAVLTLAACSRTPGGGGTLTVDYYRAHAVERAATLRTCANDPGDLRDSPNCVNAREAARVEDVGSLRSLPPMGLPAGQSGNQSTDRGASKD